MGKVKATAATAELADSSDEEHDAKSKAATAAEDKRKKPPFNKDNVLCTVLGREAPSAQPMEKRGVMQHMPAFFPDEVKQAWLSWSAATPTTLAEVPEQLRMRVCSMPMRCQPRGAQQPEVRREQRELITYKNDGGRTMTAKGLLRESDAKKKLVDGDVGLKSIVALRREAGAVSSAGGYGTPFYVGDVTAIELVSDESGGTSHTAREIKCVSVHYRMPLCRGKFCNDVKRPWALACWGMHEWDAMCERRISCKQAAISNGSATAAVMHDADPAEILESGLKLTDRTRVIALKSKECLDEHDDTGTWRDMLGLPDKSAEPEAKRSKKLKR